MSRMYRLVAGTLAAGAMATVCLSAAPLLADPWPQRTVRLIVPLGPGNAPDITARVFAERLAERWKQPVIVENRPGADGATGVAAFVNTQDDHALLFSISGPITTLPVVQEKSPYDPARDLVPIGSVADSFISIASSSSTKISSLADLVTIAKAQPGKLNYNAGAGALPYLFAGFMKNAGIDMVLVPYRETNAAVTDLAEGRLQIIVSAMATLRAQVDAGKIRQLAVTNTMRPPHAPNIPTALEAGFPDLTYEGLLGLFGARDLPAHRRSQIAADISAIAADPAVAKRLSAIGLIARSSSPDEFSASLAAERAKMAEIMRLLGHPMKP